MDLNKQIESPEVQKIEIPSYITDGINEKFILREYQEESIKRFIYYFDNKYFYQEKMKDDLLYSNKNHLLFNIATGGGKTLLMACIILHLHNKGYNNFLFLSHLNSINTKTIDNFFKKNSNKYLFNKNIDIKQNMGLFFNNNGINISINTYQGISSLLDNIQENAFNLSDIEDKKLVIIADESHHLNSGVDKKSGIWEDNINKILNTNKDNFLLEFTATIKWNDKKYNDKYLDKCIHRYDLKDFYESGYTKTISLLQRDVDIENLMLGAIILSKYRESLFNELGQNIKPVILFKSKTINDSIENNGKFNNLMENLNKKTLIDFYTTLQDNTITKKAFDYLKNKGEIGDKYEYLENILKINFNKIHIINTNKGIEIENNATLLNNLESEENIKRVIFSVDKLNEGWDVLNLFDIVKLYETQTTTETTQEAQLLGRGARYCGFKYKDKEFGKRKFIKNDGYEILEQLYFHSRQDNPSIKKLKDELKNMGIEIDNNTKTEIIKMKIDIKNKLSNELVFHNGKKEDFETDIYYEKIKEFTNKQVYNINSNKEKSFDLMDDKDINFNNISEKLVKLETFDKYIKWNAIINNIDYNFKKLKEKLKINSFNDFIEKLDAYELKIKNWDNNIINQYKIYSLFLSQIYEKVISKEYKKYTGTKNFVWKNFLGVFRDDISKEYKNDTDVLECCDEFCLYDKAILTSEEKDFIDFFRTKIYEKLENKEYEKIYLVRNEMDLKLFQFEDGKGFEPDFILFIEKNNIKYQIYIEPKGNHLIEHDNSKNDFLKEITKMTDEGKLTLNNKKDGIEIFESENYKLIGLQFYNKEIEIREERMEKEFKEFFI
jgi:type III restriction enzyme